MSSTPPLTENEHENKNTHIKSDVQSNPQANGSISSKEAATISKLLSQLPLQSDTLLFGLNFKHTTVPKKGILSRLKNKTHTLDIDISCLLFDKQKQLVDTVWFKKLRDGSEAVLHHGDSLNGKDRSAAAELDHNIDVETIELRLSKLPMTVEHLALLLSTYGDYPLKDIERGNICIEDDEGNEVYNKDLTTLDSDASAFYVALLSRELGEWRLSYKELPLPSSQMSEMTTYVQQELTTHTTHI